jgi:8-oxo-dGTP pyrophosphatase MutT (NUDIX family)
MKPAKVPHLGGWGVKYMNNFTVSLKTEMLKGLPGAEIQWQMASSDRFVKDFPRIPGKDARVAAILIILYPNKESVYTVLMQRPDYDGIHGGQISFPGGKQEPEDNDIIQTALREAYEETGVDREKINVIGTLTPLFIPVSNMNVTPVIGWTDEVPSFNHRPEEVSFLINADLKTLLDQSIVKTKSMQISDQVLDVRYFDYEGNMIWGATAMILHELLALIRRGGFFPRE